MSMFGSFFGSNDSEDAYKQSEKTYENWMNKAIGQLQSGETRGRGDINDALKAGLSYQEPYLRAGEAAEKEYGAAMGLDGGQAKQDAISRFQNSTGYQLALKHGMQSAEQGAAASGVGTSSAAEKELERRGTGMADAGYGQHLQNLQNVSGLGARAAQESGRLQMGSGGELANLGSQYASQIAGAYGNIGSAASQSDLAANLAKQKAEKEKWNIIGTLVGDPTAANEFTGFNMPQGQLKQYGSGSGGSMGSSQIPLSGGSDPYSSYRKYVSVDGIGKGENDPYASYRKYLKV